MPRAHDRSTNFTPAPRGLHQAVCCDVVGPFQEQSPWGILDKIQLRWQLNVGNPDNDNKPFMVVNKYTFSLNEKANLRQDLECWLGRVLEPSEVDAGFELDELIGQNCQIQVVHKLSSKGKTVAVVQAIVPLSPGMVPIAVSSDYVMDRNRQKRGNAVQPAPQAWSNQQPAGEEVFEGDDIPF